ncbi:MAG: NAD(P)-dependent glycerol-3-phosphate dehydrogenase [Bacteriovoracaceae bacterium]|nr:NAD(P)-dependent glycerol-3-phosphate dehydrogenase [Bacteriovoracaceae bacterium]
MTKKFKHAIIFGAGAFGTSIGSVLAHQFQKVTLIVREKELFRSVNENHQNPLYLPNVILPKECVAVMDWSDIKGQDAEEVELMVCGLPMRAIPSYLKKHKSDIASFLKRDVPLVNLAKGMDPDTLELPDDLFYNHFSEYKKQIAFLSGPSFAREIVDQQITCVSVAAPDREVLIQLIKMFNNSYFKMFPTYDAKGLLLGGALKNVLAIAAGIVEGLGLNHNTRAALITRGIEEMLRFGEVVNARPETFYGLSGMGDLILTTTGDLSRNRLFGLELAKGKSPAELMSNDRATVEGYKTTAAAYKLAQKYQIRTRIFSGLYQILFQDVSVKKVMHEVMAAPVRFGDDYINL